MAVFYKMKEFFSGKKLILSIICTCGMLFYAPLACSVGNSDSGSPDSVNAQTQMQEEEDFTVDLCENTTDTAFM